MKVLLSWSGERSRSVALALRTWLSDVNQALRPWMSAEDIGKGERWANDLARQLHETDVGIICVTPENMLSPWILFESGALSKALTNSLVCTYLVGLTPDKLSGPLSLFQATAATQDDTRRLVHTLNEALGADNARSHEQIDRSFNLWWPQLQSALAQIATIPQPQSTHRSDREILEEVLDAVRTAAQRGTSARIRDRERLDLSGLFAGDDVQRLVKRLARIVADRDRQADENAAQWPTDTSSGRYDSLDGEWSSRWNGGAASEKWMYGSATCISRGDYSLFLFDDRGLTAAVYALICIRERQDRLVGRYVNLDRPEDSTPWVGFIVDHARIDGYWTEGRWDFRR